MSLVIRKFISRTFYTSRWLLNKMTSSVDRYVWIDLEMTGLNVEKDTILEIACVITTPDLSSVHEGISLVIHQPDEVLESMNDWCIEHHGKSGLTAKSRESKISLSDAEDQVSKYIRLHTDPAGIRYMAGNSVYMDKIFLGKYMPSVNNLLHYRIIDVSCLKTLCLHWYSIDFSRIPKKKLVHRALDDIKESIEELKTYKETFFKQ